MRNTANWNNYTPGSEPVLFVAGRGFTGHEHLPWFNLINMNGRLYDPLTAQFLSPDNYVQLPNFTQNFNRYSYCLNNPLKYSDPSGEYILGILATIFCPPLIPVGMAIDAGIGFAVDYSNAKSRGLSTGQSLLYAGTNLGISVLSQNINIKGIIPNGSLHAIMGVAGNGISNLTIKEPFFENWGPSAISGGLSGGLSGYQLAKEGGLNYWWGNNIAYNRNSWSFFNVDKPDFVIDMGIPNVGSLAKNDCYPTTFSEIEAKKGGSRSYQDFAKNANYSEGKGLIINRSDYRNLMNTTFGTVDILDGNAANQVFDPSFMRMASQNGEIISFHFSGPRPHADNVRQLRVFLNAPMKNRLIFRQSGYNFSQYSGWNNIWSIFRIY